MSNQNSRTCVLLYVPAAQSRQVSLAAAENLPAAQLEQVSLAVAHSAAENLPAPQSEHVLTVVAPTAAEYLPASHLLQARSATALQFPVKPLLTTLPSDVKVTLRKPVVDV